MHYLGIDVSKQKLDCALRIDARYIRNDSDRKSVV